jgi:hypothetical protein
MIVCDSRLVPESILRAYIRISTPVAITSPARSQCVCRRLRQGHLWRGHVSKSYGDGVFSVAGVATGFGTMNNEDKIILGTRQAWGDPQPFGIGREDQRHHIYIIGKTGSGKTTLLHNMIVQHILRGDGVGLLDPHGDLAEALLDEIPTHRTDHVVYFNPADLEYPIAMNLLANIPKDERHLVASGIVGAFKLKAFGMILGDRAWNTSSTMLWLRSWIARTLPFWASTGC